MGKEKYSIEHRIEAAKSYERGEGSYKSIAQRYGVGYTTVKAWVRKYRAQGGKRVSGPAWSFKLFISF